MEIRGLDRLRERMRPERLTEPPRNLVKAVGLLAQRTAQSAAKPHEADTGKLADKIMLEVGKDRVSVFPRRSIAGIAGVIEEGRRPGRRPPYRAIKDWAESHGIVPTGRGNSRFIQALREDIRTRGTKGLHFMRKAQQAADRALKRGIAPTEEEIRKAWERG